MCQIQNKTKNTFLLNKIALFRYVKQLLQAECLKNILYKDFFLHYNY